jgi:hypothetical protein
VMPAGAEINPTCTAPIAAVLPLTRATLIRTALVVPAASALGPSTTLSVKLESSTADSVTGALTHAARRRNSAARRI